MACMFDTFEGYLDQAITQFDKLRVQDGFYYLESSSKEIEPLRLKPVDSHSSADI